MKDRIAVAPDTLLRAVTERLEAINGYNRSGLSANICSRHASFRVLTIGFSAIVLLLFINFRSTVYEASPGLSEFLSMPSSMAKHSGLGRYDTGIAAGGAGVGIGGNPTQAGGPHPRTLRLLTCLSLIMSGLSFGLALILLRRPTKRWWLIFTLTVALAVLTLITRWWLLASSTRLA